MKHIPNQTQVSTFILCTAAARLCTGRLTPVSLVTILNWWLEALVRRNAPHSTGEELYFDPTGNP